MQHNEYYALFERLHQLLESMASDPNFEIGFETVLQRVVDPVNISDTDLPSVSYAYGTTVPLETLSQTVNVHAETFSIVLYVTVNGTAEESVLLRTTKMHASLNTLVRALKAATPETQNARRLGVGSFNGKLSGDREFLRYEIGFDLLLNK